MRTMWDATIDDLRCTVKFNDDDNHYNVRVVSQVGTLVKQESFRMTCWTRPFLNIMDVNDCHIARVIAEKLSQQIEEEQRNESKS